MYIKSCKNAPFWKPASRLNPCAEEWRPPHQFNSLPVPPVVALAAHYPPQKLLWHLPPQPQYYHHPMPYLTRAWPHIIYHLPPFSFPATDRLYAAAPPLSGDGGEGVDELEVKVLEKQVEKLESPIVKGRSVLGVSKTWRPPRRWEWKPRKKVARSAAAAASPASPVVDELSPRTTVMVKNIPNQLRRDFMLEFLDSYCSAHSLEYDFMYLPMDFRSKDNLGYAFVNFTNGGDALKFKNILHSYKWGNVETDKGFYASKKICGVTWARIQGKEKLVKRFENSTFNCDDPDFLPVVFDPPRGGSNTSSPAVVGRLNHQ